MTWRRLLNRSHFNEGDYQSIPHEWQDYGGVTAWDLVAEHHASVEALLEFGKVVEKSNQDRAERNNSRIKIFLGDLRRLERDTLDERSIVGQIAWRTGIDADSVAAVLKEWMSI